jgi:hypothetical protein
MTVRLSSPQQRLIQLKTDGATPIHAIKTIHAEFGLSLADAKHELSVSKAWQQEVAVADQLHEEVIAALSKEPKREAGGA